jgi:hypothetical protein
MQERTGFVSAVTGVTLFAMDWLLPLAVALVALGGILIAIAMEQSLKTTDEADLGAAERSVADVTHRPAA